MKYSTNSITCGGIVKALISNITNPVNPDSAIFEIDDVEILYSRPIVMSFVRNQFVREQNEVSAKHKKQ